MPPLLHVRRRLRGRMWPILQTAAAAVAAWYLAQALLGRDQPLFAPIAAVIALGANSGWSRPSSAWARYHAATAAAAVCRIGHMRPRRRRRTWSNGGTPGS